MPNQTKVLELWHWETIEKYEVKSPEQNLLGEAKQKEEFVINTIFGVV